MINNMKNSLILCGSCRRGDHKVEADFKVRGKMNGMPYRANLCIAHLDMIRDDGADVELVGLLGSNAQALELWAEAVWAQYERVKREWGFGSPRADRFHQQYIRIADRLQAMGLNY
jgi:hypothetical protein